MIFTDFTLSGYSRIVNRNFCLGIFPCGSISSDGYGFFRGVRLTGNSIAESLLYFRKFYERNKMYTSLNAGQERQPTDIRDSRCVRYLMPKTDDPYLHFPVSQ